MDYEKFIYKRYDDTYSIHFKNNEELSIQTVSNLFSTFGKVLKVYTNGKVAGICIVVCATHKDAINCINGVKNNKDINILPQKIKKNKTENNKSDKKHTNNIDQKFAKLSMKHEKAVNLNDSSSVADNSSGCASTFDKGSIPSLISVNDIYDHELPTCSVRVIPAESVIVANIPPNLSIHYILHLFVQYNPICVSVMTMTPKSKIRYCHVYYKTIQEAIATMEKFDRYHLCGKELIVLTKDKLIKEAT